MSCRRICRELLWLTRFGEVDVDSAPHLDHLSHCRACRDEVGFDRAMVQRLREALLARVADASPSETAWANIVARAQAPEPPRVRLWEWSTALVARLRVATAMAFAAFALILTLNTELVPVGGQASSTDAAGGSALVGDGTSASGQGRSLPQRSSVAPVQNPRPAPGPPQRLEPTLPPAIVSQTSAAPEQAEEATEEPTNAFVLVFELIEQPAPAALLEEEPVPEPGPTPLDREPGEPS